MGSKVSVRWQLQYEHGTVVHGGREVGGAVCHDGGPSLQPLQRQSEPHVNVSCEL